MKRESMPAGDTYSEKFQITNELGLHARAAAAFVKIANQYAATVKVRKDTITINGKSIMGVLMLAAPKGATITVETAGPDAQAALTELGNLIRQKFGER